MSIFLEKVDMEGFSIDGIDTSDIDRIESQLPINGVIDLNIAELGLIMTLDGQNICQEQITKIDRMIGFREGAKNKAWAEAALVKAKESGMKTIKDKEWFAQADDDYIRACNQLVLAKAAKKWFENKAGYFSGWHYAFKTFLRRDYSLERLGNLSSEAYNNSRSFGSESHLPGRGGEIDFGGEAEWNE